MSEFHGYKCDICGDTIITGTRLSGNKAQEIIGERRKFPYCFDICDGCFNKIKREVKKDKNGGKQA